MIEKRKLKNGRRAYRVRWREAGRGSREHVRSFDRHEDAVRFETGLAQTVRWYRDNRDWWEPLRAHAPERR